MLVLSSRSLAGRTDEGIASNAETPQILSVVLLLVATCCACLLAFAQTSELGFSGVSVIKNLEEGLTAFVLPCMIGLKWHFNLIWKSQTKEDNGFYLCGLCMGEDEARS